MSYFNTTHLRGLHLLDEIENATNQESKIMALFLRNPIKRMTPSVVRSKVFRDSVPLTSVRRAMTCLTNSGHLEKTDSTRTGSYGKPEHAWELARKHRGGQS